MSKIQIAPSILSADFGRLADALHLIEKGGADIVHLDVMDGHFVPNITIGPPVVKALRKESRLPFDCHLMIENPQSYIPMFLDAGADMISIHVETEPHLDRALSLITSGGARAGIAINPATTVESISDALHCVDYVLVMSVNPGFGGQRFIPSVAGKIRRLREMIAGQSRPIDIEVDGGIDSETAPSVVSAGARILVAGSAIFRQSDPVKAMESLRVAATACAV